MATILINAASIIDIKQIVNNQKYNVNQKCHELNTRHRFQINTSFLLPTIEQLINFTNKIQAGSYTKTIIHEMLFEPVESNVISIPKVEVVENTKSKVRTVTELKIGDIVFLENLKHSFLVLNIYKSGLFKSVGLSSSPDLRQTFSINSRFSDRINYIRLTVAINEIEEFKSKWVGNISLSQVKLVKLFLKQNKL